MGRTTASFPVYAVLWVDHRYVMRFSIYQDSQVGGRDSNQDRMGYCFTREALLLILADGMGGHSHGELAAVLALQTMGDL